MRYWLLSMAIGLVVMGYCSSQATFVSAQAKDKKPPKDGKDFGKDKKEIPKELPTSPDFKVPDEVLGKGFEYWKKMIHSDDPSEREIATKNILFFGAEKAYEAVPDIIAELKDHKGNKNIDLSMRVNGIQALSTIFRYKSNPDQKHIDEAYAIYKPALGDTQVILRMQTMKALPYLGPKSRESFKTVLSLGKDGVSWEIRKEAIPVLVVMAAPDVPGGKPNPLAADALSHCYNRSNPANENSHLVRQAALQGIALLGSNVPLQLVKGLDDPSKPVRLTALQCFATMSYKWEAEVKANNSQGAIDKKFAENKLLDYLDREKDVALKMWTHAVIMTLHKKITPRHLNPILDQLNNKDQSMRLLTLQIVSLAGPDTKLLARQIVETTVRDADVNVGAAAVRTLVAMHAFESKPMLKAIYDDEKANPTVHFAVAEALDAFEAMEKMEKVRKDKEKKDKTGDDKK